MNNKHLYKTKMEIQNLITRYNINLHPPLSKFDCISEGAYYSGIKIFTHLPANIECLMNDGERFRIALRRFLNSNSVFTLEEFFNYNR